MQEILLFLQNNRIGLWNRAIKKNKIWFDWFETQFLFTTNLNEKIYLFFNNLEETPKCAVNQCNNKVNWTNNTHYTETCSHQCRMLLRHQNGTYATSNKKKEDTCLEKYGASNIMTLKEFNDKRIATIQKNNNGSKVTDKHRESMRSKAKELNKKGKIAIKEKYNVDNIQQIPAVRQKTINTFEERYGAGVTSPSQIPALKIKKRQRTLEFWQEQMPKINILSETEATDLLEEYPFANNRMTFQCNECNEIETLPSETLKYRYRNFGNACRSCCNMGINSSVGEYEVADFIKSLGIDIVQGSFDIIYPQQIDIYIPSLKIAIEYNGLYWHSEESGKLKWYHITKHNKCKELGIRLIHIFEDEWEFKRDIVKNRLKHILQQSTNDKIYARKCKVEKITTSEARNWHELHHIQGRGTGTICYGLKYNDELIAVMDFAKLSIVKGSKSIDGVWELTRFSINGSIPGAANKLFSAFIREYNPLKVISYSDLRWNTGNVYEKIGFVFTGNTLPNYWYVEGSKRVHRYKFRKSELVKQGFDETKSESEIMKERGYKKIWDCGHSKWEWSKTLDI